MSLILNVQQYFPFIQHYKDKVWRGVFQSCWEKLVNLVQETTGHGEDTSHTTIQLEVFYPKFQDVEYNF